MSTSCAGFEAELLLGPLLANSSPGSLGPPMCDSKKVSLRKCVVSERWLDLESLVTERWVRSSYF